MKRSLLVGTALAALLPAAALAQIPQGGGTTFGRNTEVQGRSFFFLNRHGYSSQVDAGRRFPTSVQTGYRTPAAPAASTTPSTNTNTNNNNTNNNGGGQTQFPPTGFSPFNLQPITPLFVPIIPGTVLTPLPGQFNPPSFVGFSGLQPTIPLVSPLSPSPFVPTSP
jgi:hypothetical protein